MRAKWLSDEIWLQVHQGDLVAALRTADVALQKFRNVQSEWHWRFWALRGEILMLQGRYEESLSFLNATLPGNIAQSDIAVWQKLSQGAACARVSRYEDGAKFLGDAEKLARQSHPELLGECALRQGILAFGRGETADAYAAYRTALQISRKQKDSFLEVASLGSLGMAATRLEHYDESVEWNKQALKLSQSLGDTRSLSRIKGNMAWGYHEIGDLENSLAGFQDAQREAERAGLVADRVYWLNSAAEVQYDLRAFASAESTSQQALALATQLKEDGARIECLQNLALVALARRDFAGVEQNLGNASGLERSTPDHSRDLYTRIIRAHLAAQTGNFPQAEHLYSEIASDDESPTSLHWEAQATLAQVHAEQGRTVLAEREFSESINAISKAWNGLKHEEFRLSFLSSAIRFYDAYVNFLIEQKRALDALKVADRSRAQTLEYGLSLGSNGTSESREDIRPQEVARKWNATLLFYWLGEQRSHLWVITPTKVSLLPLPARSEIDAHVKSYLDAFLEPLDPLETGNADGKRLYETLIEPAKKLIPRNSRVIILPDAGLNSLNFETLIVSGDKPHYWIEDVTVSTGNSLALLAKASPSAPPADASLFLMGDALQASPDFPPLPQAGKEVRLVENYFPEDGRTLFTGAQATASHFLSGKSETSSYLHFATHGTASTAHPLESAVILSPEGDSYKLYARDIVQHRLQAYLVTISACNGSGLRTYAGEGLVGLAWAFLRAGAHNVIAALWEVSNASTPQLMDELYKGLNTGKDPATALRDAKLTLVHSNGNYRRPFYWAPFQLYDGS